MFDRDEIDMWGDYKFSSNDPLSNYGNPFGAGSMAGFPTIEADGSLAPSTLSAENSNVQPEVSLNQLQPAGFLTLDDGMPVGDAVVVPTNQIGAVFGADQVVDAFRQEQAVLAAEKEVNDRQAFANLNNEITRINAASQSPAVVFADPAFNPFPNGPVNYHQDEVEDDDAEGDSDEDTLTVDRPGGEPNMLNIPSPSRTGKTKSARKEPYVKKGPGAQALGSTKKAGKRKASNWTTTSKTEPENEITDIERTAKAEAGREMLEGKPPGMKMSTRYSKKKNGK